MGSEREVWAEESRGEVGGGVRRGRSGRVSSIHIIELTRRRRISYAVFRVKKKTWTTRVLFLNCVPRQLVTCVMAPVISFTRLVTSY